MQKVMVMVMGTAHTRLRCPVCGKLSTLNRIARGTSHAVEAIKQIFSGPGRISKGEKVETGGDDTLIDYWIIRLQEVLDELKLRRRLERGEIIDAPDAVFYSDIEAVGEMDIVGEIKVVLE